MLCVPQIPCLHAHTYSRARHYGRVCAHSTLIAKYQLAHHDKFCEHFFIESEVMGHTKTCF